MRWGVGDKRQCGLTSLHSSVVSGLCGGDAMPPVVSSSTYWIPPSAREACPPPDKLPDQTRNYVDPWDLENYAYLRRHARIDHTAPLPNRRRSVAFDEAVHYASYSDVTRVAPIAFSDKREVRRFWKMEDEKMSCRWSSILSHPRRPTDRIMTENWPQEGDRREKTVDSRESLNLESGIKEKILSSHQIEPVRMFCVIGDTISAAS
ncbi:hypothetical protein AAG570_009900 [Ranatra chinensis]|uniref:Uncharacterized protein n=1 Tax=Ranatra chinensis TaxID=642074 RepID=A0ABD0ZDP9_9HEMI